MRSAPPPQVWSRIGSWGVLAALLALVCIDGCSQTVEVGLDHALIDAGAGAGGALPVAGVGGGGGAVTGGSGNQAGAPACVETLCRGNPYACGNCDDDDGDGMVDALDMDCLGPCDDDELGLSTGLITNQSAGCRQDCYFDGDNGPGNDKCEWSHSCDPLSVAPNYPPSGEVRCEFGAVMGVDCVGLSSVQPTACTDVCLPLVPNGCDCFGCCELPGGSGEFHFIGVGRGEQGCQRGNLDDALACPPCTPVKDSCFNPCEKCETCVDKPPDPTCNPGNGCLDGEDCGPEKLCEYGDYCVTGCCVRAPEPT